MDNCLTEKSLEDVLVQLKTDSCLTIETNRMALSPEAINLMTKEELELIDGGGLEALSFERRRELSQKLIMIASGGH